MVSSPCSRNGLRGALRAALPPLAGLFFWSGSPVLHALTLDEAVALAQMRSPAVAASESEARALRELAVQAGTRPDPMLRLSLNNLPVNGTDRWSTTRDFMTMRSVGVEQALPSSGKREARRAERDRQADAQLAQAAAQAAAARRKAAWAWWDLRAAGLRRQAIQAQTVHAADLLLAAEAAWRGGRGSASALIAARDEGLRLQQALLVAVEEQEVARTALQRWTQVVPEQLPEAPAIDTELPTDITLLTQHPEGLVAQARTAATRAMASLADAERSPDWSVELMYSRRGSRYTDMVSVGLSIPLTLDRAHRQDRELAARLAEADAREAEAEDVQRELARQFQTWRSQWRSALAQRELIDSQREPLARQRVQAVLAAYRTGQEPMASVIEAQQAALALALERIDVELSAARAWSALAFALPSSRQLVTAAGDHP